MTELDVALADPESPDGRAAISGFFAEIIGRRLGRPATADEVARIMRDEPSADLRGETGFFVLVRDAGRTVGCGGVRIVEPTFGEVSRIFVAPEARGRCVAATLMRELETVATRRGLHRLRLTVRDDLVEARRLYERAGYRPVEPFSDSPYADHFLAKDLTETD